MPRNREELADLVRKAFRGVTLGDDIGLWEGQALDDYADEATRRRYHERDEKRDWERIPNEDLNRCQSSLSFFDPEGMRFHLPAYLIAEIEGRTDVGCVFHLTHLDDYAKGKLVALSLEQTEAVREFAWELPTHSRGEEPPARLHPRRGGDRQQPWVGRDSVHGLGQEEPAVLRQQRS